MDLQLLPHRLAMSPLLLSPEFLTHNAAGKIKRCLKPRVFQGADELITQPTVTGTVSTTAALGEVRQCRRRRGEGKELSGSHKETQSPGQWLSRLCLRPSINLQFTPTCSCR